MPAIAATTCWFIRVVTLNQAPRRITMYTKLYGGGRPSPPGRGTRPVTPAARAVVIAWASILSAPVWEATQPQPGRSPARRLRR